MPTLIRKPHKWIDARIESLDPEVDWAEIYKLMSTYQSGDFMNDVIYAFIFPHFMVPFHGAEPVWREGTKAKVVDRASLRVDDTNYHNMVWAHYGPDHAETHKSVGTINKIHAYYAQRYPENFTHHADYVYVWCSSATLMHRAMLKMGLPGLAEKQKIAAYRFWKEMGPLFAVPGDDRPIEGYPDDFDGLLAWIEEFEGRDWPVNRAGAMTSRAVLDQFLHRRVPRLLHPVVRAAFYSFSSPSMLKAYEITPPNRLVSAVLRRLCGVALVVSSMVTSEPTENYIDQRNKMTTDDKRQHRRVLKEQDESFARVFTSWLGRSNKVLVEAPAAAAAHTTTAHTTTADAAAGPSMGCPHPMGRRVDPTG